MNFFTISTFRDVVASLIKKPREGYSSVVADICAELQSMPDNILRDTCLTAQDRFKKYLDYFRIPYEEG